MARIRNQTRPITLVLDGHDATGKTTLATSLAAALNARYVRPFAGEAGARLLRLAEGGDFDGASCHARESIARAAEEESTVLVFDRHWMTVFSLIPERLWGGWEPLPPTTLCWADLQTTLARLGQRSEDPRPAAEHRHYLDVYLRLAAQFGCPTVRTDLLAADESLDRLIRWARTHTGQ